jgi:hypothetical protein
VTEHQPKDIGTPAGPNQRAILASGVGLGVVPLFTLLQARRALAHHGWGTFDTRHAYYVVGPLASVRWGNLHTEAALRVEQASLPANWGQRPLPSGANEGQGRLTMASARPYPGPHRELHLVLAGPSWMERWGLNRPLQVGERIEAVGFLDGQGGDDFRPAMFWLADGQGVWQQLTSFPRDPEPAR